MSMDTTSLTITQAEDLRRKALRLQRELEIKLKTLADPRFTRLSTDAEPILRTMFNANQERILTLTHYINQQKESLKCQRNRT